MDREVQLNDIDAGAVRKKRLVDSFQGFDDVKTQFPIREWLALLHKAVDKMMAFGLQWFNQANPGNADITFAQGELKFGERAFNLFPVETKIEVTKRYWMSVNRRDQATQD